MTAIPANALRRGWLLDRLEGLSVGLKIRRELGRLNRAAAARLDFRDPRRCLMELAREAARRFPVAEVYDIVATFDDQGDAGEWLYLWLHGIPCNVQGYHPDNGDHVCDLVMLDVGEWFEDAADLRGWWNERESRDLARWWPGKPDAAQIEAAGQPPRGRRFVGVWAGLPDLVAYVRAETFNGWLDENFEDADGMTMPEWTAAEIRSMERGWKRARPILDRVTRLTHYIEQDLPVRLPQLDRALRGDAATLQRITRKAPPKTLVDVLVRKGRKHLHRPTGAM